MDLTNYVPTPISTMKARFDEAKYDSALLVKAELETIEEITNGKAVLVDASSPVTMLLEMAACMASNCVQENVVLLRRQYPALAATTHELYLHMSDEDLLDRFATPGSATFSALVLLSELKAAMVYDATEGVYKVVIPRETTITVDNVVFTTLYPIVFRMSNTGAIQIVYDADIANPVYGLTNTIIPCEIRKTADLIEWLCFDFKALQVKIATEYQILEKAYNFQKTIAFADAFYYARVFYRNSQSGTTWVEMTTTHTDQVFNVTNPTALLTVGDSVLTVAIPTIYLTTGALSGELRIDIYTTKGVLSMPLKNYTADKFVVSPSAIDETRDLSDYTAALSSVSYSVFSVDVASGGSDAIDFETLRNRVIYNAVGPQVLPITNVQIEAEATTEGFSIVKNVDLLTNRVFLATRRLPTPTNPKLITPANLGMITFASTMEAMASNTFVIDNGDRYTIKSKALWKVTNGQTVLLSKSDVDALHAKTQTAMMVELNAANYYYTPFYYVLDASQEEFEVRAYALDQPRASGLNFVRQNQTLQLYVNTNATGYSLTKVASGYELRIKTVSGNYYKNTTDSEVGVQLMFYPDGETTPAYINGVQESKGADEERIFLFPIKTTHDFDSNNLFPVTNSRIEGITNPKVWIRLDTSFKILHWTTSVNKTFAADATDLLIGKFALPPGAVGNSQESIKLHFGDALNSLWRRARSYSNNVTYQRYSTDIPARYTNDIYDTDPVTGSMLSIVDGKPTYTLLHKAGDVITDASGNTLYIHRAGDVVLDEQNVPVVDISSMTGREMDLLVVDGRYFFANDTASISYREEIEAIVVDWIVDSLSSLQNRVLEQTKVFFYPKTTLGSVVVKVENGDEKVIEAEQSFTVALHVNYITYSDADVRETLRVKTIELLDTYVAKTVVNMTEIANELRLLYGDAVKAFQISGLGGTANYAIVTLDSERTKLCLKKELVAQADQTLIVQDDVTVEFYLVA